MKKYTIKIPCNYIYEIEAPNEKEALKEVIEIGFGRQNAGMSPHVVNWGLDLPSEFYHDAFIVDEEGT